MTQLLGKPQQATIVYEDESFESLTKPYIIAVNGQTVERFATHAQASRYARWKGYKVIDEVETAQAELEQFMEAQAQEIAPELELIPHSLAAA
jgi:hypothetical protein